MVCENVMLLLAPACQLVTVFGAVTVMVGFTMVKFTSLSSCTVLLSTATARMRAVVVAGPVTFHAYVPLVADVVTKVVMFCQDAPPSRLTSRFNDCPMPRLCVNVMFWLAVTFQLTAVLGAVTVTRFVPCETCSDAFTVWVSAPAVPVIVSG
jgi:hypothetical protein